MLGKVDGRNSGLKADIHWKYVMTHGQIETSLLIPTSGRSLAHRGPLYIHRASAIPRALTPRWHIGYDT